MDQANVQPNQANSYGWSLVLAIAVTVDAFVRVFDRWGALGILLRLEAVGLLALLVIMPMGFVRADRKGKPLERTHVLGFVYILVLVTIQVFASR